MFSALVIILILFKSDLGSTKGLQFRPLSKLFFYIFVVNLIMLLQLGAKHVESPFIELGQLCTVFYFSYFIVIMPIISIIENTFMDLNRNK
jgi:ubiquinol-cytochrome c reductase cytochrome b subunit